MLSINQIAPLIKLTEMLKASHDPQYPMKNTRQENPIATRSVTQGGLVKVGRSTRSKKSFMCDAAKVLKIRTSKKLAIHFPKLK